MRHLFLELAINALVLQFREFRMSVVNQLVDPHRDRHEAQLESKGVAKLFRQLGNQMTWDVVPSPVVPLHQSKHFRFHAGLGSQVELSRRIGLNRSKCELALVGDQVRQDRFLLWLVE